MDENNKHKIFKNKTVAYIEDTDFHTDPTWPLVGFIFSAAFLDLHSFTHKLNRAIKFSWINVHLILENKSF